MAIAFYMDVHIPQAITVQLRRRGVDILTAVEDSTPELPDSELLALQFHKVLYLLNNNENFPIKDRYYFCQYIANMGLPEKLKKFPNLIRLSVYTDIVKKDQL